MSTDISGMIECRPGARLRGPDDVHGATWLTWAELVDVDWQETDAAGTQTRASAAGTDTRWGRVWNVMRILAGVHGPENVRLVVRFD